MLLDPPPNSMFVTPEWVRNAVFYQIFPDRFARGDVPKPPNLEPWDGPPTVRGFKGGDLEGVLRSLDYLQDLGVNAIYFNPIFQSTANHRYHTHDYFRVDPLLGGDSAFDRLLVEAHRRGIRMILDGVFNHASRGFFQFNHILENGAQSPYVSWFHVFEFPLNAYIPHARPNYGAWWQLPELPKFNTSSPMVREFLWQVGEYWIRRGVDGWRLDVPNEIDDPAFWAEFRRRVKQANPAAYIVGEIWDNASRWLQGDQFDAVMNYPFTRACLGFFARDTLDLSMINGTGLAGIAPLEAHEFGLTLSGLLTLYPPQAVVAQLNLLDSHDTARFRTIAMGDESAQRLAVLCQMTYPGAPCVYYGDEIGMTGGKDPDSRRTMIWDPGRWNADLLAYYKQVIALRHTHPALRRGDFTLLDAGQDLVAYSRRSGTEVIVILLNAARADRRANLTVLPVIPDGTTLRDIFSGRTIQATEGKLSDVYLSPRSGAAYIGEIGVTS